MMLGHSSELDHKFFLVKLLQGIQNGVVRVLLSWVIGVSVNPPKVDSGPIVSSRRIFRTVKATEVQLPAFCPRSGSALGTIPNVCFPSAGSSVLGHTDEATAL